MLVVNAITTIAMTVRQCPEAAIAQAYIRAVREWCRESQWYGVNVTALLQADDDVYDINQLGQLEALNVDAVSLQPLPIAPGSGPVPINRTDPGWVIPDSTPAQPIKYAYLPEGAIQFWPPPDQAYPVTVRVICQPIDGAVEVPDELLVKWRTAFEAGALAFLLGLDGEPWANPSKALLQHGLFRSKINDAKADKQRGYRVGSVRATPRSFVTRSAGGR